MYQNDTTFLRYKCIFQINKISKNKIYTYNYKNKWNIRADFDLLPQKREDVFNEYGEFIITGTELIPNPKWDLIPFEGILFLEKISYNKNGLKVFSFVRFFATSMETSEYKYIKEVGCIEFKTDSDIYKLHKIDYKVVDF
jgi:hypothetical protein